MRRSLWPASCGAARAAPAPGPSRCRMLRAGAKPPKGHGGVRWGASARFHGEVVLLRNSFQLSGFFLLVRCLGFSSPETRYYLSC